MTLKQRTHLRTLRNERTKLVTLLIRSTDTWAKDSYAREMARINDGIRRMEAIR